MTSIDGRSHSLMYLWFPARLSHYGDHGPWCLVSSSRPSNRACGWCGTGIRQKPAAASGNCWSEAGGRVIVAGG